MENRRAFALWRKICCATKKPKEADRFDSPKKMNEKYIHVHLVQRQSNWRLAVGATLLVVALWLVVKNYVELQWFAASGAAGKRNVIFMVSDGCGPASFTFARDYAQYLNQHPELLASVGAGSKWQQPHHFHLALDEILVGQSRTQSSNSFITDSAAGATAFSCGTKTYNGAIAANDSYAPCATVLEVAKSQGYHTALVVTSRITHATPAAFSAHVTFRDYESQIAVQQLGETPFGRSVDLMFGGGLGFFLPNTTAGSMRDDARDLVAEAKTRFGFNSVLTAREQFDAMEPAAASLPAVGLFATDHMSFSLDRDPSKQPALHEMVHKALNTMEAATQHSEQGFFMLIEGSRIDMAAHNNDPAAHVHDILEYQKTVAMVREFADQHPGTLIISVSDHETGGLTVGRQSPSGRYEWFPEVIARVKNSTEAIASLLRKCPDEKRQDFVRNVVLPLMLGIDDFTDDDVSKILTLKSYELMQYMSNMVSTRALVGWTTHGHTGVDVNLFAYNGRGLRRNHASVDSLRGSHENTDLHGVVAEHLQLDPKKQSTMTNQLIQAAANGKLIMYPPGKPPMPTDFVGETYHHQHD